MENIFHAIKTFQTKCQEFLFEFRRMEPTGNFTVMLNGNMSIPNHPASVKAS